MKRWLPVLFVIAAACGGGKSKVVSSSPTSTSTSVTETTTTASGGHTSVSDRAMSSRVTTTVPARPSGSSSSAQPAMPAAAGTYKFDTSGYSQSSGGDRRNMPSATTLKADPASNGSQHTTRDLRDSNGQGQVIETTFVYQPDGVHLSELKIITALGGGITDVRDLKADPPPLIARTGGGPGDHYDFTLTGSGTTAKGTVAVQRTEPLTIAGKTINTVVAKLHVDLSGAVSGAQDATNWIDPAHLLTVKEQVVTDAHAGAVSTHTEYTATMQKEDPS